MRAGDEAWEAVKNYYETVESSDQKLVALGTLGSGETKELILKALNYTLTSAVRSQARLLSWVVVVASGVCV